MNSDGSNITKLTTLSTSVPTAQKPLYSSDGSKILFGLNDSGLLDLEVAIMNADGSAITMLTNDAITHSWSNWASDGRILYTEYDTNNPDTKKLYAMHTDGSNVQEWPLPDGVDNIHYVEMTDDGQFIYYRGEDDYLHVMTSDGSADFNFRIWAVLPDHHSGL